MPYHKENGHRIVGTHQKGRNEPVSRFGTKNILGKVGKWRDFHQVGYLSERGTVRHDDPENGAHSNAIQNVQPNPFRLELIMQCLG